jgi:SPP1 family predicted phage head-tail adaptor
MVNINTIRSKLDNVFNRNDINRTIEIIRYDYEENEYGDEVKEFYFQDTVKAIVLDYKKIAPKYDPAGKYAESTVVVLLPHNFVLSDKDELIIGDDEYSVIKQEPVYIGEKIVFQRTFAQKKTI